MRNKKFKMVVGHYFFSIRNGQSQIVISRDNKRAAEVAYLNYKEVGKDCEWLGIWKGKKFEETTAPKAA